MTHRAAVDVTSIDELIGAEIDSIDPGERFSDAMGHGGRERISVGAAGALIGHSVTVAPGGRTATIAQDGLYLCAIPGEAPVKATRNVAAGWETFACLTEQDAKDLIFIVHQQWILGSAGRLLDRGEVTTGPHDYMLHLGPVAADLRYNMPLAVDQRGGEHGDIMSVTVLADGWRIERIFLFKPMIFLTAFNAPEYMAQAQHCISSLIEFGGYQGAIHVISDMPAEAFQAMVPEIEWARLSVQTVDAADWVGYVASKYCLLEWPNARQYQPILFLDPDAMADADITPMLIAIATSPRVMAPMEDFSPLATNPSVGASLLQRAGASPRFACGFNGGTIGIPNLDAHLATLRLIRAIIINHLELYGRDSFRWVDQEVANYVSYAHSNFDTATLLRYVRFGWERTEFSSIGRVGFVHFFPPRGGVAKSVAMRIYTETLRMAEAAQQALTV